MSGWYGQKITRYKYFLWCLLWNSWFTCVIDYNLLLLQQGLSWLLLYVFLCMLLWLRLLRKDNSGSRGTSWRKTSRCDHRSYESDCSNWNAADCRFALVWSTVKLTRFKQRSNGHWITYRITLGRTRSLYSVTARCYFDGLLLTASQQLWSASQQLWLASQQLWSASQHLWLAVASWHPHMVKPIIYSYAIKLLLKIKKAR